MVVTLSLSEFPIYNNLTLLTNSKVDQFLGFLKTSFIIFFFAKIRSYEFSRNNILTNNLIVILRETWNIDKKRLEKWIFENFRGSFVDDVIYRDDLYLWSKEKTKKKAKLSEVNVVDIFEPLDGKIFTRKLV